MDDHIADTDLFSYVEGVSGGLRRKQMRAHIAACPACKARCRSARGFIAAFRRTYPDTLSEPVPGHLLARAMGLIPTSQDQLAETRFDSTPTPLLEQISHRVRTLIAKLLPLPAAPAFARGQSDTVRLLFSAEDTEIPLCAFRSQAGGAWTLVGRISTAPHSSEWYVTLTGVGEAVATSFVGPDKEFVFDNVAPGAYSISFSAAAQDVRIDVPAFRVE